MAKAETRAPQSVEDYLKLPYTIRVTADPTGGYVAAVDELPGCITQAETWEEAGAMIRDAMAGWIDITLQDSRAVPVPDLELAPARFLLRLPRTLYEVLTRAAAHEGVSLNQYMLYVLASATGRLSGWERPSSSGAASAPANVVNRRAGRSSSRSRAG